MALTRLSSDRDVVAQALLSGAIVGLGTDTVYGVAAALSHAPAVRSLFVLKNRPVTVALPILCANLEQAHALGCVVSERDRRMAELFWPGPLTLVLRAHNEVCEVVAAINDVGVRVPHDDVLRELLLVTGPLAVTSANLHGRPPCTTGEQVAESFGVESGLAVIWDRGLRQAPVSTVVRVYDGSITMLREGAIARDAIAAVLEDE